MCYSILQRHRPILFLWNNLPTLTRFIRITTVCKTGLILILLDLLSKTPSDGAYFFVCQMFASFFQTPKYLPLIYLNGFYVFEVRIRLSYMGESNSRSTKCLNSIQRIAIWLINNQFLCANLPLDRRRTIRNICLFYEYTLLFNY